MIEHLMVWGKRIFGNFRVRYIPLLMIYFAYGAAGFAGIAESFWSKEELTLSAEALILIGFWIFGKFMRKHERVICHFNFIVS